MEEYNKIVRDNIPTIIENSGFKCETEIVSDEEALEYFFCNKEHFGTPATVSAKHILTDKEEDCENVKNVIVII